MSEKKEEKVDREELSKAEHTVGIVKAKLLLKNPFFGVLLSMTDFIAETSIPTMATDGSKVYYSPKFVNKLSENEVFGVILHERALQRQDLQRSLCLLAKTHRALLPQETLNCIVVLQ